MAYESKRYTPPKKSGTTSGSAAGAADGSGAKSAKDTDGAKATAASSYANSGRYTPPAPRTAASGTAARPESPAWVAWLMFAFFGLGLLIIVLNYTNIIWQANTWSLFAGLGAIIAGFITATQLK